MAHAGVRCGVGGQGRSLRVSDGTTRPSLAIELSFKVLSARILDDFTASKADISGIGLSRLLCVAVEDSDEEDMDADPSSFCCALFLGDDVKCFGTN